MFQPHRNILRALLASRLAAQARSQIIVNLDDDELGPQLKFEFDEKEELDQRHNDGGHASDHCIVDEIPAPSIEDLEFDCGLLKLLQEELLQQKIQYEHFIESITSDELAEILSQATLFLFLPSAFGDGQVFVSDIAYRRIIENLQPYFSMGSISERYNEIADYDYYYSQSFSMFEAKQCELFDVIVSKLHQIMALNANLIAVRARIKDDGVML